MFDPPVVLGHLECQQEVGPLGTPGPWTRHVPSSSTKSYNLRRSNWVPAHVSKWNRELEAIVAICMVENSISKKLLLAHQGS
jgi:hypothetical protein